MAFRLAVSPTFEAQVRIDVAGIEAAFTGKFKRISQQRMDELNELIARREISDQDIVDEVFAGWGDDLQDEAGAPLADDAAGRAKLFAIAGVRGCIARAFFDAYLPARRGNW